MPDLTAPNLTAADGLRSGRVFAVTLSLVLMAVAFPEMSAQGLQGLLWTGAGLLMVLYPPVVSVPRLWTLLAVGFVGFSLIGFLPREWFSATSWRGDLERLGLDTGPHAFVQARLAAEVMVGFTVTALFVLFLLGHRVDSGRHQRVALGFAIGVGVWAAAALVAHEPGSVFGFFPNRNHTATLLVMGIFTGLGCLAHAIRRKDVWKMLLSTIPVGVCLYAIHAVSESRAGVVLVFVGFVLWIALTGVRHLHGNVGKALILILIAASGTFIIVDSTAKKRLTATVGQMTSAGPISGDIPENPFIAASIARPDPPTDGRIAIFKDTLQMVRQEPWTGVGPGQFAQVFPQYRQETNASNDARCLHPESDWLMMLAELGWPSVVCLVAGVGAVFVTATRQARRGRARFLRTGSIVAALLLCVHGIFDVPGHRVGLAWGAALLLATSLRPEAEKGGGIVLQPSRFAANSWRILGLCIALAGGSLTYAQWIQRSVLPSEKVRRYLVEARRLYDQDQAAYDRATAQGLEYDPAALVDPLEIAQLKLQQAIGITPLDPYLHYLHGSLALHYDDKHAVAGRAFAIQRRLDPIRVNVPMDQARAWHIQDPDQVKTLWKESLRRASQEEIRIPGSTSGVANSFQRIIDGAGKDVPLATAAFELAGQEPTLLLQWARAAPDSLLDREMPGLLIAPIDSDARNLLFQTWEKRGSKGTAGDFAKSHPDLELHSAEAAGDPASK